MSYIRYPAAGGGGVDTYANFAAFPASATDGTLALALDTDILYAYNTGLASWVVIGGPGAALSIGTIDTGTPSANGAQISANALILQSASATRPGLMNTGAQTIAGAKTFSGAISASNLSGTNTGDVTLGATATSGGLTLAGQVLSASASSTSTPGWLSAADWNTFNGKQAAGSYITALTGDATASGPGSAALTLATVNGNVGSFGGATAVSTFTVNAKGLITAAGSTSIQIAESQVTNLVSDLAGKQPTGNYLTALTGDVTAAGPGSSAATIAANAVTNAKAAQMATLTLKGNNTGGTANALDLTVAQVNAILPVFTSLLNGLVPASGGGTSNFLRADGNWAAAGTGTVTAVSVTSANGFAGSSGGGATPALTLSTTVTGILKGNGTAMSAAVAGDFPTLNQNTTGTAAGLSVTLVQGSGGTGFSTYTTGDILYASATNTLSKLAATTNGFVLTLAAGIPSWAAASAPSLAVTTQTSTYAILTTDSLILVSTNVFTATLPTAVGVTGKVYYIRKTDADITKIITLATTSSQTIGQYGTTVTLNTQGETWQVVSDGANWQVLAHIIPGTWTSYAPAFNGFATPTNVVVRWRRVGDSIDIQGTFNAGTSPSGSMRIGMPTGATSNSTQLNSVSTIVPGAINFPVSGAANASEAATPFISGGTGSNISFTCFAYSSNSHNLTEIDSSAAFGSGQAIAFSAFGIPVSGWTA